MTDESKDKDKSLSFDESNDTGNNTKEVLLESSEKSDDDATDTQNLLSESSEKSDDDATDTQNSLSESSDKADENTKNTQKAPRASEEYDDNTLSFDEAYSGRNRHKKEYDPTRDTAVFSKDDRRIRRILSSHYSDESDGTMALGEKQEVILLIRGMVERVMMQTGMLYKLGRFELGINEVDEIDLTPYGAQDRGVSRIHAQLQIIDAIVHITDLGSTNGTFVNGTRLELNTPTALRKGDELLLGRLTVQVLFR